MAIPGLPNAGGDDDDTASLVDVPVTPSAHPPALVAQHSSHLSTVSAATVDIEAWTVSALQSLNISPIARGTGTPLSIPLDAELLLSSSNTHGYGQGHGRGNNNASRAAAARQPGGDGDNNTPVRMKLRHVTIRDDGEARVSSSRRLPLRRDSLRRREALLMGKEGSRQRRRWENDRLLHVPNVEPPLPTDWEVQPTHPVNHVPYQLAQFWDNGLRERVEARKTAFAAAARRKGGKSGGSRKKIADTADAALAATAAAQEVGRVPKDLRATAKRTPAVKSWLRGLEEPVRRFLVESGVVDVAADSSGSDDSSHSGSRDGAEGHDDEHEMDSEDEEIVFRGRNAAAAARRAGEKMWKKARREVPDRPAEAGLVLDSEAGEDEGAAAFKRWLTHSISDYYGLDSRSVTVGNPARRVVYVGIRQMKTGRGPTVFAELPPPLWEMF